jgi:hypothetical protein
VIVSERKEALQQNRFPAIIAPELSKEHMHVKWREQEPSDCVHTQFYMLSEAPDSIVFCLEAHEKSSVSALLSRLLAVILCVLCYVKKKSKNTTRMTRKTN